MEDQSPEFYLVKGHQKLAEGGVNANSIAYRRFTDNNGPGFSFEEFEKIVEYNNRCDALANVFINEHRQEPGGAEDGAGAAWD